MTLLKLFLLILELTSQDLSLFFAGIGVFREFCLFSGSFFYRFLAFSQQCFLLSDDRRLQLCLRLR